MKKYLFILFIIFCLAGCNQASPNTPNSQPPVVTVSDVPELTVVYQDEEVTAWRGTSSWQIQNEDGKGSAIHSDSPHPLSMREHIPSLSLPPAASPVEPLVVSLQFELVPDGVSVRCWSAECWEQTDAESEGLPVQMLMIDSDPASSPIYQVELKDGDCIYEVYAKWNQTELYGGDSCYSFCTVSSDLCGYPLTTES